MFRPHERNIRVAISPFCNLDCVYCNGQNGRRSKPGAMEDFRHTPVEQGIIDIHTCLEIIRVLHVAGFGGMTLTGGEPFLNPEWGRIVDKARELGMSRIGVTTNGMLLKEYIRRNGRLPQALTLLTISLDTIDPDRYMAITRKGDLGKVINGLKAAKETNPDLMVRANKVLLRSDMGSLIDYVRYCERIGVIDEINLLNLILKDPVDKKFFEREFVFVSEAIDTLSSLDGVDFSVDSRYELETSLPSGLRIILKDTNATLRNSLCSDCPIYCQEGFFTVRVATDGTITPCPDLKAELAYLDGPRELKNGTLVEKVEKMVRFISEAEQRNSLEDFFRVKDVHLRCS